jgi:signal recognition particle receptor subunit beta
MVLFNYSTRELTAKIVYYGPGLCGKTTNLQFIHGNLPEDVKGKMLSLSTKTDRTLFFDFLPIDLGEIRGMKTRVQLYTVPGQVFYNETRKLVLKGADGIVFVADSQAQMLGANVESFKNLEENLKGHGLKLAEMPHVLQFNKRDLPKVSTIEEINNAINKYNVPFYESVATTGIGVQDTLKAITKLVLMHLTKKYDPKAAQAEKQAPPAAAEAPQIPAAVPVQPEIKPEPVPVAAMMQNEEPSTGIPLSEVPFPAAQPAAQAAPEPISAQPAPEPVQAPAVEEPETPPAFADSEIDKLIDEVEETVDEVQAEEAATPVFEIDADGLSLEEAIGEPEKAEAPAMEQAAAEPDPEPDEQPHFEVEHKVEPDWPDQQEPQEEPSEDSGNLSYQTVLDALKKGPEVEAEPAEPAQPTLTEVVEDKELFEDPSLEVARMAAGQEREIVIPVEMKDGEKAVRRFKLSIKLRLDDVD